MLFPHDGDVHRSEAHSGRVDQKTPLVSPLATHRRDPRVCSVSRSYETASLSLAGRVAEGDREPTYVSASAEDGVRTPFTAVGLELPTLG